jgi:hypothetical protein
MKRVGNVASNRTYNPQNAKPAIPFDADEADSAMERFIRQKYQDPAVKTQRRQNTGSTNSDDHPPPLPPKTGSRFGFRSASSIFPLSSKARREAAARPTSSDRSPSPPRRNKQSKLFGADVGQPNPDDFESKIAKLQDMGFQDERQNLTVLKRVSGDLEKAIETLIKLGDGQNSVGKSRWGQDSGLSSGSRTPTSATGGISLNPTREKSLPRPSSNPFDMLDTPPAPAPPQSSQSTGTLAHPQSQMMGSNPFQQNSNSVGLGPSQSQYSLNQAFQNMTVSAPSQPLFPNHTGGFPGQQQQQQQQLQLHMQSMTPPVPSIPQQYYPPVIYENPAQQPQQSYNPFMQQQQRQPPPLNTNFQPNPYAQDRAPFSAPVSNMQSTIFQQQQQQTPQGTRAGVNVQTGPYAQQQQASHNPVQTPTDQATALYGNNTSQQVPQQYSQQNPFLQNNTQQAPQQLYTSQPQQVYNFQPQQQNPYQQFQGNMNPLVSQQTGRADKRSILELYNYPQLAPTPLQQQQAQNQGPVPAPAFDTQQQQRITSGPLSADFGGSRNPFTGGGGLQSAGGNLAAGAGQFGQAPARHTSQESVSVNAGDWQNGRHSPDAWGTISARSMR